MVLALALNWAQLADKALCKMIGERSNTPHLLLALLPSFLMDGIKMVLAYKALALCKMIDRRMWQSPLTLTASLSSLPFELEII